MGRTHLSHKLEHTVDLTNGSVVTVNVVPADAGETATVAEMMQVVAFNLGLVMPQACGRGTPQIAGVQGCRADQFFARLQQ